MINKTNYHLRIYIPRLDHDHPETDGNRFVGIVKCIRGITRIGLKDAKGIVDADDKWHNVPIYKHQDSVWDVDGDNVFIDKLYELGCQAWIEKETERPTVKQDHMEWNKAGDRLINWALTKETLTVEQDYMDTLGSLMEGATPKEEATPKKEADMIVDLKHYILMAINLKQYKMAKYLIDNLAQYEEGK